MVQMDSRRMCPHCRAFITNKDRTCPYCNEPVGARAIDRRNPSPILGGIIPHARFNTVVILLINFGLFLATALYSMGAGNGEALWNIDVGNAGGVRRQVQRGAGGRPVVAPGHRRLPARRPAPHPHELLGAVRPRRPGGGNLRRGPHAGDLFRLHRLWLLR